MSNEPSLTKRDILEAASARITDSNLDQLVEGHFATLRLHDDLDLIEGLDTAKDWLLGNRSKLNIKGYNPDINASEIEQQV